MSVQAYVSGMADWEAVHREHTRIWHRIRIIMQFFDRLFPFVSVGIYAFVAVIFYRQPHCTAYGQTAFLIFWLACLSGAIISAINDERRTFRRHESCTDWPLMFRCVRQVAIIAAEFVTVSLSINSNFVCSEAGRVVIKSVLPVLYVVVPAAELLRYAVLMRDRLELMDRLVAFEWELEEHEMLDVCHSMARRRNRGQTNDDDDARRPAYEGELP
jgi:hypothetical protein